MRKSHRLQPLWASAVMTVLAHWNRHEYEKRNAVPIVEFGIRKPPVFLLIPYSTWEEGPKRKTAHPFCVTLTSVLRLYWSPEPAVVAKGQPCRLAAAWRIWAQVAVAAHQGGTLKIRFRVWRGIKVIMDHSSRTSWISHGTALPDSFSQFFFARFDSQNRNMRTQMILPEKDFIQPGTAFKIKWDITQLFCPQT